LGSTRDVCSPLWSERSDTSQGGWYGHGPSNETGHRPPHGARRSGRRSLEADAGGADAILRGGLQVRRTQPPDAALRLSLPLEQDGPLRPEGGDRATPRAEGREHHEAG